MDSSNALKISGLNFINEDIIIPLILVAIWCEYIWELYLSIRQYNVYKSTTKIPSELVDSVDQTTFEKSRLYALDKCKFSLAKDLYSVVLGTLMISCYFIFHMWEYSKFILENLGFSYCELSVSAVFLVLTLTFNNIISLPFSIYSTFVLEEKHGFNKQTPAFFIKDQLKSYLVLLVIAVPLSIGAVYIIKIGGDYFFLYLWVFTMVVLLFLMTVYPDYIAPLFDKYTPLPDGELRTQIEDLAKSLEFPLYKLYLVEGSKRSVHSNAYFYGFFKNKRIVLFDTLLKDETKSDNKGCDNEEILAVLSHEFGHWKYNHVLKNIIIMQVNLFLQFYAFQLLFQYPELYKAFKFENERPIIIGLIILLQFLFSPYHSITSFLLTTLGRKFEFQADYYAKSLGKANALRKSLIKLHNDNLSFPVYDWLYSAWHHSHPPLLQRLEALKKDD